MTLALLLACSEYDVENFSVHDAFQSPVEVQRADILFVVDDSASMSEEQGRLADNFEAFVTVLGDSRADWQLAVTTTSSVGTGVLQGEILLPERRDLESAFQAQVQVGTNGSREEQGLASALAVIQTHPELLREEADLHVVFVSDEDDHSPAPVKTYLESYQSAAGTGSVALHALVGDLPEGCASGLLAADAGKRYLNAAELSEGLTESICAEDYSAVLERVGLEVAGWQSVFALSTLAAPGTLTVHVDGVEIPEREVDGWIYSVGDNAVKFSGRAVPRPGMWVEVDYTRYLGAHQEG